MKPWLLAAQLLALWPVAYWLALQWRYASADRQECVAAFAWLACVVWWQRCGRPECAKRTDGALLGPSLCLLACGLWSALVPVQWPVALLAATGLTWTASLLLAGRKFSLALYGLALLALPLVPLFEYQLGLPLRLVAARGAAGLLRLSGLDVRAVGTALDAEDTRVWVDPPCAGLSMVWTALFITFAASLLWKLENRAVAAGTLFALLSVLAANALRAASLFLVETGTLALPAWSHAGVGLVLQLATLVLVLLVLRPREPRRPCVPTPSTS